MTSPNLTPTPKWLSAFACAIAILTPFAVNAGPMEKNPVVENLQRPFDWTGFYIGANVGGSLGEYELRGSGGDTDGHLFSDVNLTQQFPELLPVEDTFFRFVDQPLKDRPDREEFVSSVIGGLQLGYQHQFGHFVVGIEGDFDRTSLRITRSFRDFTPLVVEILDIEGNTSITAESELIGRRTAESNWQGSVRAKFGYATGPLLFYGTAGVTFAQMEVWSHDVASTFFMEQNIESRSRNEPNQFPNSSFRVVNTEIDKDDDTLVGLDSGLRTGSSLQ